jgi:hypothetical protein
MGGSEQRVTTVDASLIKADVATALRDRASENPGPEEPPPSSAPIEVIERKQSLSYLPPQNRFVSAKTIERKIGEIS